MKNRTAVTKDTTIGNELRSYEKRMPESVWTVADKQIIGQVTECLCIS